MKMPDPLFFFNNIQLNDAGNIVSYSVPLATEQLFIRSDVKTILAV